MKILKTLRLFSIFTLYSTISAVDFAYQYEIKNRVLVYAELKYNNINTTYKNKEYTSLNLSFDSTLKAILKNKDEVLDSMQVTSNIPILHKAIIDISEVSSSKKVERLSPEDKALYDWGIKIIKQFGVQVLPPQQSPWYKKYWGYLLSALGICVGTYCYIKYASKSSVK